MDALLAEAVQAGDIEGLYASLSGVPCSPFTHTPLHIAAAEGKAEFASEIMIIWPSLGRKLNQSGYTPMHLALMNGHEEVVRKLLVIDSELVRIKGKNGWTPLHYAVVLQRNTSLIGGMMEACPDSIQELTTKGETALHICVKSEHDEYEAFSVLLKCIKASKMDNIFSRLDDEGYSVLHHAIFRRKLKMIQLLFREYHDVGSMVGVNKTSRNGLTALDILENLQMEPISSKIKWCLKLGGALRAQDRFYHRWFRPYTLTRMNLDSTR